MKDLSDPFVEEDYLKRYLCECSLKQCDTKNNMETRILGWYRRVSIDWNLSLWPFFLYPLEPYLFPFFYYLSLDKTEIKLSTSSSICMWAPFPLDYNILTHNISRKGDFVLPREPSKHRTLSQRCIIILLMLPQRRHLLHMRPKHRRHNFHRRPLPRLATPTSTHDIFQNLRPILCQLRTYTLLENGFAKFFRGFDVSEWFLEGANLP